MSLKGKKILITAGPTFEAIDPVRYIGNRSTGKMGIAIAEAAVAKGAQVTLVLGPTQLRPKSASIAVIGVESGDDMYNACLKYFDDSDIVIKSAAVADYKPKSTAEHKIKKNEPTLTLELVKTTDILYELGQRKTKQFLVGFALETQDLVQNAKSKLAKKNLDLVVANYSKETGEGFGHDTNKVILLDKNNKMYNFELKSKQEVAVDILNVIEECLDKK